MGCLTAAMMVAFTMVGCAQGVLTKYSVTPIAPTDGPVKPVLSKGQIVAAQRKANTILVYFDQGRAHTGYRADVFIALKNDTGHPIEANPGDVWFEAIGPTGKRGLLTYSPDELIAYTNQVYNNRAAVAILLGGLRAVAASYANSTTYYHGTVSGYAPGGYVGGTYVPGTYVYGSYSGTEYNPAAGALAAEIENRETDRQLGAIAAERDTAIQRLKAELFAHRTIQPGETYIGMIRTRPDPAAEMYDQIRVNVSFGGEEYSFTYKVSSNRY